MKLFSQHGALQGGKTIDGIAKGYVDGIIYSPRDIKASKLKDHVDEVAGVNPVADQFFDPQYYAGFNVSDSDARRGYLATAEFADYFRIRRRRDLESGLDKIREDIRNCLKFQEGFSLTGLVSPNILITRSLDSIEGVISKNFIRQAGELHAKLLLKKPLYITLALSREALMDKHELVAFLTDITLLDKVPTGFYLLVAARQEEARTDIYSADVIGAWMLINYTLALNGYHVINGYSDILTPFLGAAGAAAGATGWWSNLRTFSLSRFLPATGGRLPIQRYLSKTLLNRIAYFELDKLRRICPKVLNRLETDGLYDAEEGSLPDRAKEVWQSWEATRSLCGDLCKGDTKSDLDRCRRAISTAYRAYDEVGAAIDAIDPKSNSDHLPALEEGLKVFSRLAEIPNPSGETM